MKRIQNKYDLVVVGGGHAGIEASLIAHKRGVKTILVSMDKNSVGRTSCNPAVGGLAKGQMVKEVDVLGGIMGFFADLSTLQSKTLNKSKGRSVWSPRSQIDKNLYEKIAQEYIKEQNLDVLEGEVVSLDIKNSSVSGVFLKDGSKIVCSSVILTCGTFLNGLIHIGSKQINAGRYGEKRAEGITENLNSLGLKSGRLKTGTPPRIKRSSVDWKMGDAGFGDKTPSPLSYRTENFKPKDEPCFSFRTNENTHNIIMDNLSSSAMYSGKNMATGPRYCPSIEDKINRFSHRPRHQIFAEPEGWNTIEFYINGFSSSLPEEVQLEGLRSIEGFENAKMFRPGYAVEYDYFPPTQLKHSLETKLVENLFFSGQINGTTGYEEAAGQGIMAGINAHQKINANEPFILSRDEAYIGVLIDDLITKGTKEPYRMFTSRAEYRILLRQDNADLRLHEKAYELGLLSKSKFELVKAKIAETKSLSNYIKKLSIEPDKINPILQKKKSNEIKQKVKAPSIISRPFITINDVVESSETLQNFVKDLDYKSESLEQVEIDIKYKGYIDREKDLADKIKKLEYVEIPNYINYERFSSLSNESKEKLNSVKPVNIGQASRISGIKPSDISILLVYLGR